MLSMLVAYDAAGAVVGTQDHRTMFDENGDAIGLVDFAAYADAGGDLTDFCKPNGATGAAAWPEWLGSRAHDFRVELEGKPGNKRIAALVHKDSGHRRERAAIEDAIAGRIAAAGDGPADIRSIVGGPDRPLRLDANGRNAPTPVHSASHLPIVRAANVDR